MDVLLPLGEQKGKHFAEKFGKEEKTTFWYQDERRVVCGRAHVVRYVDMYMWFGMWTCTCGSVCRRAHVVRYVDMHTRFGM